MPDREFITLIIRLCTLIVLIGIMIMLADALPFLTHAARIYVRMYG
jgi:hypothetical protein